MVRVFESRRNKGAIVSLLVAVLAAGSVWLGHWVWHRDDLVVPVQRTLEDVIVTWRCPGGHRFEAHGKAEAIPCPTCRQPAQIVITYRCMEHGPQEVTVMFDPASGKPTNVQYAPGGWVEVTDSIPCPSCGRRMHPQARTPFDGQVPSANRKAGGDSADLPS
ncbi:MAG: hypothetical protein GY842_11235 [bacterium]|nr:hypothetical protein [bacterium]